MQNAADYHDDIWLVFALAWERVAYRHEREFAEWFDLGGEG